MGAWVDDLAQKHGTLHNMCMRSGRHSQYSRRSFMLRHLHIALAVVDLFFFSLHSKE